MAIAYYGVCVPDKKTWVETPEGFVIFRNAVIGRTGFQSYKGYELDKGELMEQGYPVNDEDEIQLYRSPDEVFSPATIASFECKSITDGHPSELLSIENVREHEEGQVVNVHRGNEALESGDYPLVADLVIKSRRLLDKIKSGLRELSCGYNYHVLKDGDLIRQVDIIGNHVAVVENARAGREAAIGDENPIPPQERWNPQVNILDRVLNSNRKAKLTSWAKDAKPEEVADIIDSLTKDLESRPDVVTHVSVAATDVKPDPERERLHKALDTALNGDTNTIDVKALKKALFDKAAKVDDQEEEEEKEGKDAAEDAAEDEEEEEGTDSAIDESSLVIEPADRPVSLGPGTDSAEIVAARVEGAKQVLKQLKPFIAKSGNKKLLAAYDTAVKAVTGKSRVSTPGGYGAFAAAANQRGREAQDSVDNAAQKKVMDTLSGYEKLYAERFNVTKRG